MIAELPREGRSPGSIKDLETQMKQAAKMLEFEAPGSCATFRSSNCARSWRATLPTWSATSRDIDAASRRPNGSGRAGGGQASPDRAARPGGTYASNYDSPPAIALREAGAVIFAKTTMPDCGLMASGISLAARHHPQPLGLAWNTGGSSAGAGASVAAGAGYVSVGTDIAGSVRLPAAHCGLAGLKPTHGRVPHLPADTMRMAGPIGRSVDDIARLLTVLTRQDERDTWSLPADGVRYHERLKRDVKGLKIGVLTDMGFGMKPEAIVRETVEAAGKLLAGAGAIVSEPFISPLDHDAYAAIDLFLQVRGYLEYTSLPSHTDTPRDINPLVRAWSLGGAKHSGTDLYRALGRIAKMKAALLGGLSKAGTMSSHRRCRW